MERQTLHVSAGGPYRIEVRIAELPLDRLSGILVGDIWLLAGNRTWKAGLPDRGDSAPSCRSQL